MLCLIWRHPRPAGAQGRCIGRSDVSLDPRKAKRLARRIQRIATAKELPRLIWTSPLRRSRDVGRWLRRWGWRHRVDAQLAELDFGCWDGRCWDDIGTVDVAAWCADFASYRPGGGESVAQLMARCQAWLEERAAAGDAAVLIVGHGGWINAARRIADGAGVPQAAVEWPAALAYGECTDIRLDNGY